MSDNMGLVPMSAELTMFYHDFESSLAFAAQQERERIIKLLEEPLLKMLGFASVGLTDSAGVFDTEEAIAQKDAIIALIKGEQK